jgi:hypothetical protein
MSKKPRMVYMICVPPPNISDAIEHWARHQARYRPFIEDDHAKREVRHASAVIAWKLGGEQGPPPRREIPPLPLAPRFGETMPT